MLEEEWKKVNGYEISNFGRIINKKGEEYLGSINQGYKTCNLDLGEIYGKVHSFHRAVAVVFIPNPENKPEVNHIDGDKLNNRWDNLEWVTKKENQQHVSKVLHKRIGEKNWNSNLTDDLVMEIYEKGKNTDVTYVEIAKEYGIFTTHVSQILRGVKWRHLNLKPIYRYNKKDRLNINTY